MKKIEVYFLHLEKTDQALSEEVNIAIKDGWQPFGSPTITICARGHMIFCQVMVKYEKAEL